MEKKSAVYICTGCGIGDALNIEELTKLATEDEGVPICKTHPNLCSEEGVSVIKKDMEDMAVQKLICDKSPKLHCHQY